MVAVFAWLASSLGAIGAIFYASGFLISTAHLQLLGLSQIMTYSHEHYVQQGGEFMRYIAAYWMQAGLLFSIVVVLPIFLAANIFQRWTGAEHRRWVSKLQRLLRWERWPWRGIAYLALFGMLGFVCSDPQSFEQPLALSKLLFNPTNPAPKSAAAALVSKFLSGDTNGLDAAFERLLLPHFLASVLFVFSFFVTQTWAPTLRRLAIAPFALVFLLYTILLPMVFGVLKVPVEFPTARVHLSGDTALQDGPRIFLLNKTEKEFILFDQDRRTMIWLPHERIERIEIDGIASILKRSVPEPAHTP